MHTYIQTDRQTDRQIDRHTDRQADRHQIVVFFTRPRQEIVGFLARAHASGLTCFSSNVTKTMTAFIGDRRGLSSFIGDRRGLSSSANLLFFTWQRQDTFGFFGRARVSGLTCFSYNVKKSVTAYIGDRRGLL